MKKEPNKEQSMSDKKAQAKESLKVIQGGLRDIEDWLNESSAPRPEPSEFAKALKKRQEEDGLVKQNCDVCFELGWQTCREKFLAKGLELNGDDIYPAVRREFMEIAAELDADKPSA